MNARSLRGCGLVVVLGGGLVIGLAVVLVGGVFAVTRPVVDAADQFLTRLGQGDVAGAYASTADGFRAQHNEASFAAAVKTLGLSEYASASWHNRQIENQNALAEGTATTKGGGTKPVSVRFVREGGRWAVVGVRFGGVELTAPPAGLPVPTGAELERMVADSLLEFNRAVRAKDFTAFYATLADVWKKETTARKLQQTFQAFLDRDVDIGPIKDVKPRVAPAPAVNDKGMLVVAGHYPIRPSQVRFELEYAHERGGWKLTGISVRVGTGVSGE